MKRVVTTTITSLVDTETFESTHSIQVEDPDALAEVSTEILGNVLRGAASGLFTTTNQQFPIPEESKPEPPTPIRKKRAPAKKTAATPRKRS